MKMINTKKDFIGNGNTKKIASKYYFHCCPSSKKKLICRSVFQFTGKYSFQVGSSEAGILQMFMILITLLYD